MSEQPSDFNPGFFVASGLLEQASGLPDDRRMDISILVRFHPDISRSLTDPPDNNGFVTISTCPFVELPLGTINYWYRSASNGVTRLMHGVKGFQVYDRAAQTKKEAGQITKVRFEGDAVLLGHAQLLAAQVRELPERVATTGVFKRRPPVAVTFDQPR